MPEFRKIDLETSLTFFLFFLKVITKKGLCHLNIDFTLGSPPQSVFQMFTDPRNMGIFHSMGKYKKHWRTRLVCFTH